MADRGGGPVHGERSGRRRPPDLFLDAEGNFWLHQGCDLQAVRGRYRKAEGRLELDGTNLALTIGKDGRLEAPGVVFSRGEDQ